MLQIEAGTIPENLFRPRSIRIKFLSWDKAFGILHTKLFASRLITLLTYVLKQGYSKILFRVLLSLLDAHTAYIFSC